MSTVVIETVKTHTVEVESPQSEVIEIDVYSESLEVVSIGIQGPTGPIGLTGPADPAIKRIISNISTSTTAGAVALRDYVYFITGTTTLTLPTAVGNTNRYTVKNVSGVTIIACSGAETIDGTPTIVLAVEDSVDLVSNNVEWKIV